MRYYQLFLFFLLAFGVCSCDKESDKNPLTLSATSIVEYEISFYTKEGKITSQKEIDELIERKTYSLVRISLDQFLKSFLPEITYLSGSKAQLMFKNENEEKRRLIYETDDLIYFEKQEVLEYPAYVGYGVDYGLIYGYGVNNYTLDSRKFKPLFYEIVDIPTTNGSTQIIREKECFYIKKVDGELIVPMYKYYLDKDDNGDGMRTNYRYTDPGNNEFNENCVSVMGDRDTLIVEQYYIKME